MYLKKSSKDSSLNKLKGISGNWLWFYSILSISLKTIIFLGFIYSSNHLTFNFKRGLNHVPSFPLYIAFAVLFLSISFLFSGRHRLACLIVLNIIFSIVIQGDLMNFRAFGNFLSLHMFEQTSNLHNLSDSIVSMVHGIDIIFILDILILILISLKNKNLYTKNTKRRFALFFFSVILSCSYIYYEHYAADIARTKKDRIVFRVCWAPHQTYYNLSSIGYHIYDSYQYLKDKQPLKLTSKDKDEIKNWFENKKENLPDNKYAGIFKGKNLIVLQVESLENFVIGQKINGQEITPNLNKLLKNSLYFPNYYEQVYTGTSSDSDLMTNTSIYPVRRGTTFFRFPKNTYKASMPNVMKENGYSTIAIHPDKGAYWNWMPALKSIGFDKCVDESNFKLDEIIGLGLSDGSYLKQVVPIVSKMNKPFYTFMVTLTSHGPFNIDDEYRDLKLDPSLDSTKLGGYFQSINYTDRQIGKFISDLEAAGLLKDTAIAIYGDHCGVHKFYNDEVQQIQPAEDWWIDNHKKIPLIIYNSAVKGEEIKTIGGQVDLMPTLCYLMDIPKSKYENYTIGRNLLNTNKNFAVLANRTFIGTSKSKEEKEAAIKGIDISIKIIESNYFKK